MTSPEELCGEPSAKPGWAPCDLPAGHKGEIHTWPLIPPPVPCRMRCGEVYDFAWCETHDTTFALGEICPEGPAR